MKRVFHVTDSGKVKDLGWHGLGEAPEVASLDVKAAPHSLVTIPAG